MNSEVYSQYPSEGEILLMEGAPVLVLGHSVVEIKNKHPSVQQFAGNKVTVIYMMTTW